MIAHQPRCRLTRPAGRERLPHPGAFLLCLLLALGVGACQEPTASLDTPPNLQVGDWWTVEVDPTLVGVTIPTTLVVTERDASGARIGIPPEEFQHDFLVLHIPPLGDLDLATVGWHVMWADFEPLRFPLELGRSWEADFHGNDVTAEVTATDGSRAHVTMTGPNDRIDLIYDAAVGMITDFRQEQLQLNFRVVDHGSGYEGRVLSPTGIRLAIMEAGPASPRDPDTGEGGTLSTEVEVASGRSHGSLSLVLWNAGSEDEPGRYRITATAPDGTVFEEGFQTEAGSPSVIPSSFGHDVVDGTWRIEFEREGPGRLLVELFTYDLEEVLLGG
jgi:hypothetical protein